jgi:hypothetical protein
MKLNLLWQSAVPIWSEVPSFLCFHKKRLTMEAETFSETFDILFTLTRLIIRDNVTAFIRPESSKFHGLADYSNATGKLMPTVSLLPVLCGLFHVAFSIWII